jgi:hypothetical protein
MTTGICLRCLEVGRVDRHHLILKVRGNYPYPDLWALLCPACHRGAHVVLRSADLERADALTPALVDGQVASFLGWLAWRGEVVTIPAELLSGLALLLERNGRCWEAR